MEGLYRGLTGGVLLELLLCAAAKSEERSVLQLPEAEVAVGCCPAAEEGEVGQCCAAD